MRPNASIRQPPPLMAPPPSLSSPAQPGQPTGTAATLQKMTRHQPGRRPTMHSASAAGQSASPAQLQSPTLSQQQAPTSQPQPAQPQTPQQQPPAPPAGTATTTTAGSSADDGAGSVVLLRVVCDDNTVKTIKINTSTNTFYDLKCMFKAKFNPDNVNKNKTKQHKN